MLAFSYHACNRWRSHADVSQSPCQAPGNLQLGHDVTAFQHAKAMGHSMYKLQHWSPSSSALPFVVLLECILRERALLWHSSPLMLLEKDKDMHIHKCSVLVQMMTCQNHAGPHHRTAWDDLD